MHSQSATAYISDEIEGDGFMSIWSGSAAYASNEMKARSQAVGNWRSEIRGDRREFAVVSGKAVTAAPRLFPDIPGSR